MSIKTHHVEFVESIDLASSKVQLDHVIDADQGIRVSHGTPIVGAENRHTASMAGLRVVAARGGLVGLLQSL
jgi:hypothetical protein